ncbi:hypothetical protein U1Q18_027023 [Sarracenia purpurea var. burkii]
MIASGWQKPDLSRSIEEKEDLETWSVINGRWLMRLKMMEARSGGEVVGVGRLNSRKEEEDVPAPVGL